MIKLMLFWLVRVSYFWVGGGGLAISSSMAQKRVVRVFGETENNKSSSKLHPPSFLLSSPIPLTHFPLPYLSTSLPLHHPKPPLLHPPIPHPQSLLHLPPLTLPSSQPPLPPHSIPKPSAPKTNLPLTPSHNPLPSPSSPRKTTTPYPNNPQSPFSPSRERLKYKRPEIPTLISYSKLHPPPRRTRGPQVQKKFELHARKSRIPNPYNDTR